MNAIIFFFQLTSNVQINFCSTLDIKNLKLIESTANKDTKDNNSHNSENVSASEAPSVSSNGYNANSQVIEDNQKKKGDYYYYFVYSIINKLVSNSL